MAAGLYRLDRTDSLTPPSDITAFITGGTTGFYMVGINGNNIFSHNRHRISYKALLLLAADRLLGYRLFGRSE